PKDFMEVIAAALKYECIKGGQTITMDTHATSNEPEPMDVDAVQINSPLPASIMTNSNESVFMMAQVKELIQVAAMTMWSGNNGNRERGNNRHQGRQQTPDHMISIEINGTIMQ
ncbi:hypothetical protein J3B02_006364, partial [Coemansia erecta]